MEKSSKTILIGWDAADWKIINPLLDQGLLPNLQKMVERGTIGNLSTLDPAYSPMLWTSIATGKHAYKHGILGFTEVNSDDTAIRPVMGSSRKVKALWEILSHQNYKCHTVGWWPSHPAEKINGISLSNFYQKDTGKLDEAWDMPDGCVHPQELREHFANLRIHPEELTGQHLLPFVPKADKIDQKNDQKLYAVAKITAHAASIQSAFTNIIRTKEWDFACVYFDALDHYCHGFMKYHPPKLEYISQDLFDLYHHVVTAGYRYHDMLLGRIIELAGEETNIILVSDHGFQPDHLRPKEIPKEPGGLASEHSPYGIFCAMGPNIKKDSITYGASLLDICPTILHLLGIPIGQDMDGKVLIDIFQESNRISTIPTWDSIPFSSIHNLDLDSNSEKAMLKQLVELGYIDPINSNMSIEVEKTKEFNQNNLAKSYLEGGKIQEAIKIYEHLHDKKPQIARYAFQLALCHQMTGDFSKCRILVQKLKKQKSYKEEALSILEGSLLQGEGRFVEALEIFEQANKESNAQNISLKFNIAKCYSSLNALDEAEKVLQNLLTIDYDFPKAHRLLGIVHFKKKDFKASLESIYNAISLEYNDSISHLYAGINLKSIGHYSEAAHHLEVALLMNPKMNLARQELSVLYKTHLGEPNKAALHKQNMEFHYEGEIIIVSGLPRSGTSMMMQMLNAGGAEIYADNTRKPSKDNPKGFFEHESVKSLSYNKRWVPLAEGKCVKVISNLLHHLPANYKYKVIFMDRDLLEIVKSQQVMLSETAESNSFSLIRSFTKSLKRTKKWLVRSPNIEVIHINYHDVIKNPFAEALKVKDFLDREMVVHEMANSVDTTLYRTRATSEDFIKNM